MTAMPFRVDKSSELAATESATLRQLPSGRRVMLHVEGGQEAIAICSPTGAVEVRIALPDAGPVVSLGAARLEREAGEAVGIRCRTFEVSASESMQLTSEGTVGITGDAMQVTTDNDVRLNGRYVLLNCDNGDPAAMVQAAADEVASVAGSVVTDHCCSGG